MTTIVTRSGKGSPLTHTEVDTNFTNLNTAKLEAGAIALGSAATPSISFTGDTNTGIYSPGADQVAVATNGVQRINIEADGDINIDGGGVFYDATNNRLAIGSTAPQEKLEVNGNIANTLGCGGTLVLYDAVVGRNNRIQLGADASGAFINATYTIGGTGQLRFQTLGQERGRFDESGSLLVGTSTARSNVNLQSGDRTPSVQIETAVDSYNNGLSIINNSASGFAPQLSLGLSLSTSIGSNTNVAPSTSAAIGMINFVGNDGDQFLTGARIEAVTDATTSNNDMPCRLVFSTTADGSASPTEHMRINNGGAFKASTSGTYSGATSLYNEFFQSTNSMGLFIRCTNGSQTASVLEVNADRITTNNTYNLFDAYNGNISGRFSIRDSGNAVNTNNSYAGISDVKLKENIVDASSQWDDLKALQVRNYNFKEGQTHTQIGLVAQEVELVSPGLVSKSPDRDVEGNDLGTVTKSVNYSVLYMKAVKALQEAMERIEQLETSNTDLLARVIALETA